MPNWTWTPIDDDWNKNYFLLQEYIEMNNQMIPKRDKYKSITLGSWVQTQKARYKLNKIPQDRIQKLENLKFWVWDSKESEWNNNFEKLKQYSEKYQNCRPTGNNSLNTWAKTQRHDYKHTSYKLHDN